MRSLLISKTWRQYPFHNTPPIQVTRFYIIFLLSNFVFLFLNKVCIVLFSTFILESQPIVVGVEEMLNVLAILEDTCLSYVAPLGTNLCTNINRPLAPTLLSTGYFKTYAPITWSFWPSHLILLSYNHGTFPKHLFEISCYILSP